MKRFVLCSIAATMAAAAMPALASDAYINQIYSAPKVSVTTPGFSAAAPVLELVAPTPHMPIDTAYYLSLFESYGLPQANGAENWSSIVQTGDGNSAGALQSGTGNASLVAQRGDGNFAFAAQTGQWNSSAIYQTGFGMQATVTQNGNSNRALIVQSN